MCTASGNGLTLDAASLGVLPSSGRGCCVTISYLGNLPGAVMAEAISTFRLG
jgi:hypothetical protein